MSDSDEDESNRGDRGDGDEELDLDKLFEAIPSEKTESNEGSDSGSGNGDSEVSLLDEEEFESLPESEDIEADREILGGNTADTFSELGSEESEGDGIENVGVEEIEDKQRSRKPGSGRFDKLLADIDPNQSSKDLDELLSSLSGSGFRSQTADRDEEGVGRSMADESTETSAKSSGEITFEADKAGLMEPSDTLFMGPRDGRRNRDTCHPLFSTYSIEDKNVLLISLQDSSEERLDSFFSNQSAHPANLAVVTGSDAVRSTTTSRGGDAAEDASNISVKVVSDPGDLTRLGITISNILQSWTGNGHETIVCFDSVSALLQYADLQRVFRFIHVLQGRLDELRARTHYHLEPDAHDNRTIGTLQPLFDGTIRRAADGTLTYE